MNFELGFHCVLTLPWPYIFPQTIIASLGREMCPHKSQFVDVYLTFLHGRVQWVKE
jgi:hypothetical protein